MRMNGINYSTYLRNNTVSSLFGTSSYNSIYSNLSQLASVRSGAYGKALKAYYASQNNSSALDTVKSKTNLLLNTDSNITDVKKAASDLISSANKLSSAGKDSIFANKDTYNPDEAYKTVSDFAKEYNDTVSALGKTGNTSVQSIGNSMKRMTDILKINLGKVGVKVASDGKLSVDEETFKKACMTDVKSLFGSNGSYARIISSSAQRLQSAAIKQSINNTNPLLNTGSVYGRNGSYYNSYYSGINYNNFF